MVIIKNLGFALFGILVIVAALALSGCVSKNVQDSATKTNLIYTLIPISNRADGSVTKIQFEAPTGLKVSGYALTSVESGHGTDGLDRIVIYAVRRDTLNSVYDEMVGNYIGDQHAIQPTVTQNTLRKPGFYDDQAQYYIGPIEWTHIYDGIAADGNKFAMWKETDVPSPEDKGLDGFAAVIENHANGGYIMLNVATATTDSYWNYNPRLYPEDALPIFKSMRIISDKANTESGLPASNPVS